ncbi:MAG: polyprenyl synthetase family protein [Rehaibacterium terrae]|uniref:polyprenyl synthetase family protein n=1 Tax=Rehaibacterium terrae TaxID=1341696 RepID=UPI00391C3952
MRSEARFGAWAARAEAALERALPADTAPPQRLHAAMRHATLGGGKRLRPLLVYAAGAALDADEAALDFPAAAVELIHAYSLVHDDLPAMDDDALRRGKPTVHVAYDEATAILAGDALQTLAFSVVADTPVADAVRVELLRTLAAGAAGMCSGQALDLAATGRAQPLDELQRMHALKTGALIRAAVRLGALVGGADAALLARLDRFAADLGLAFQIRDDLLDIEGSAEQLGKTAGKDAAQAKSTYPALLGMDESRRRLHRLGDSMRDTLAPLGERAAALAALGELAIHRDR